MRLQQRYFVRVVNIICIVHITSYLACNVRHILHSFIPTVDIVCIDRVTSYLARNVCHILHIYSSSVDYWCIISFFFFNIICFSVHCSFSFVHFLSQYELNPNPIRIYVPPFITSIKASFYFPFFNIIITFCFMLYTHVVWTSCCIISCFTFFIGVLYKHVVCVFIKMLYACCTNVLCQIVVLMRERVV